MSLGLCALRRGRGRDADDPRPVRSIFTRHHLAGFGRGSPHRRLQRLRQRSGRLGVVLLTREPRRRRLL